MDQREPVARLAADLADRVGVPTCVAVCCDLLGGAPRERYVEELRALTGFAWDPGDDVFDPTTWHDYWVRTWGARGLLHVWHDDAAPAVLAGLGDEHYRPAEMCLKVATAHDVAGAGPHAARLAGHALPRVRVQALRCLAVTGDVEHVTVVEQHLADDVVEVRRRASQVLTAMRRRLDL